MRTLKHPNVIQLHEIIYDDQEAYIIEEYCEEGDLEYYLKRQLKLKKRLPEDVISRWMLQILLGIEYLHHLKIIHRYSNILSRDIRPKNIFLTSTGNLKLGSFKASKQL
jgi:NIMA (never in mitosis gene a)-related kinase